MNLPKSIALFVTGLALCSNLYGAEYYVRPDGVDVADGGTAENPFKTPCYALAKAANADTVYFYPGVYNLTNTPQITANYITLKGLGATRDDVVFDAGGQRRCLDIGFPDSGSNRQNYYRVGTTLSGITFRRGYLNQKSGAYNNWGYDFGAGVRLANTYGNSAPVTASVITNCAFVACTNELSYGGAMNCGGGVKIVDCLFRDNYAGTGYGNGGEPGGGALFLQPAAADVEIERCTFENCVASNGVSAIATGSYNGTYDQNAFCVRLKDCIFSGNRGENHSGSEMQCSVLGAKVRDVSRCTFASNRVESCASGANVRGAIMSVRGASAWTNCFAGCVFEGNHSDGWGGCFGVAGNRRLCLTNCTFTANESFYNGAVVFCARVGNNDYSDTPLTIEGCSFFRNRTLCDTAYNCGGIVTAGIGSRILRSEFMANETYGWCGVIESMSNTNLVIDSCTFSANVIRPQSSGTVSGHSGFLLVGGMSQVSYGMPEIRNCLFACNTNLEANTKGHVAFLRGHFSRVHNCTFVGNRSAEPDADAYGVFLFNAVGYEVRNCLFADNHAIGSDVSNNGFGRSEYVRYCAEDADSLNVNTEWGMNVRNATMRFVDVQGGDYRPTKRTPGRDTGLEFAWMAGAKDLSGETDRIVNGIPDFGCYEWVYIPCGMSIIFR